MNKIIRKIDEEINIRNKIIKNSHGMELDTRATISGLQIAKEFIQAEQKEPCCKEIKCTYNETGCGDCQYTKNLNKVIKANGDLIRESNESLAEFIYNITTNCITGKCLECKLYKACEHTDNTGDIEDYLNQSVTSTTKI